MGPKVLGTYIILINTILIIVFTQGVIYIFNCHDCLFIVLSKFYLKNTLQHQFISHKIKY